MARPTVETPAGPEVGVTVTTPGARLALPSPLRLRDFRLLVLGQAVSTGGDMFFAVAAPFLIFAIGGGAAMLTATLTAFGLTRLVVALPAGALADRIGPRPLMAGADILRSVAVGVLTTVAATGRPSIVLLVAVGAALGIGEGCYRPASRALVPALVADEQLPAANSINISANLVAFVAGPAIAGVVVAVASPAIMLGLDAASFVCSVVTLVLIRGGRGPATVDDAGVAPAEPRTVWSFLRQSAVFRVVLLMMAVIGLSIAGALQVALPVLARERPYLGVAGYGFAMTALGAGMVLGGLSAGRLAAIRHQGRLVIALLAANAVLLAAVPNMPGLATTLATMVVLGASDGALGVIVMTMLQRLPPPHLRGRALAAVAFVNFVMYPLSVAGAGGALSHIGAAAVIEISGLGVALVAAIGAASARVRNV